MSCQALGADAEEDPTANEDQVALQKMGKSKTTDKNIKDTEDEVINLGPVEKCLVRMEELEMDIVAMIRSTKN